MSKSGKSMTSGAAARIQSAGARNAHSQTAQLGFAARAQSAAATNGQGGGSKAGGPK